MSSKKPILFGGINKCTLMRVIKKENQGAWIESRER